MPDDRCHLPCLDLKKAERLRRERLDPIRATRQAEQARALADPTRLTVAAALAGADELCVCDLAHWPVPTLYGARLAGPARHADHDCAAL